MEQFRPRPGDRGRRDLLTDPGSRDLVEDGECRDLFRDPGEQDLLRDRGTRDSFRLEAWLNGRIPDERILQRVSLKSGAFAVRRRRE
jgi:hypothetical protein